MMQTWYWSCISIIHGIIKKHFENLIYLIKLFLKDTLLSDVGVEVGEVPIPFRKASIAPPNKLGSTKLASSHCTSLPSSFSSMMRSFTWIKGPESLLFTSGTTSRNDPVFFRQMSSLTLLVGGGGCTTVRTGALKVGGGRKVAGNWDGSKELDLDDRKDPRLSGEFGATLREGDFNTGIGDVGRLDATGTISSAGEDTRRSLLQATGTGTCIRDMRSSFLQTMPRMSALPNYRKNKK